MSTPALTLVRGGRYARRGRGAPEPLAFDDDGVLVPPPQAAPSRPAWAWRLVFALGTVVWALALVGVRALVGQVPSALTLDSRGEVAGIIRNTAQAPMLVTITLYWASEDSTGRVVLGREVRARVSPRTTTLAPFESQTFRLRVSEAVPHGTTLRLVTLFEPQDVAPPSPDTTRIVARIAIATRLITRVLVP